MEGIRLSSPEEDKLQLEDYHCPLLMLFFIHVLFLSIVPSSIQSPKSEPWESLLKKPGAEKFKR